VASVICVIILSNPLTYLITIKVQYVPVYLSGQCHKISSLYMHTLNAFSHIFCIGSGVSGPLSATDVNTAGISNEPIPPVGTTPTTCKNHKLEHQIKYCKLAMPYLRVNWMRQIL